MQDGCLAHAWFFAVVVPVIAVGIKRYRDSWFRPLTFIRIRRKLACIRKRNTVRQRDAVEAEILGLDSKLFTKMFRMTPAAFKSLHNLIRPILRSKWTPKSQKMAELSSGSCVETIVLLAGTVRRLAGGSLWDISFMFRMSYSTIHARKWDVIAAINTVLFSTLSVIANYIFTIKFFSGNFFSFCNP